MSRPSVGRSPGPSREGDVIGVLTNTKQLQQILVDEVQLSQIIDGILSIDQSSARSFLGRTTLSAYRKVHNLVSSALDRISTSPEFREGLLSDLSKALILVKYQSAREQISQSIARCIESIIKVVGDAMRGYASEIRGGGKGDWEKVKKFAKNARTLIDSLAVIAYEYL